MHQTIRNIGIFAHVDAGKTTLTEQLLLAAGAIGKAGRVDDGAAHTDRLLIERQRGISVRKSTVAIEHRGHTIYIIDTPGHVDFSAEVENALLAIDGAVLVVSAVEGVQAQTAAIYRVLAALQIPTIAMINKIDRDGADVGGVLGQLESLAERPLRVDAARELLIDRLSEFDEPLLEIALTGDVAPDDIDAALARGCRAMRALPVVCGSALKGVGIDGVLEAIVRFLPPPTLCDEFSVAAYHVERVGDERRVHVRVFGGALIRGRIYDGHRIRWLRAIRQEGLVRVEQLGAGETGVVIGADDLRVGDWLGKPLRSPAQLSPPLFRVRVLPEDGSQMPELKAALERIADEQPEFAPRFEPRTRQLHIQVMGEIQRQIIEQTLQDEHGIACQLTDVEVLLRETPKGTATGSLDMMCSPWNARATFRIEPLPRGSGVRFKSIVPTDLYIKYQRDIEATTYECLKEGLHGWPVTDILVTLTDGECATITHPGSRFGPVVPLGIFDALRRADTHLLEPMLAFEARVDIHAAGTLLYELSTCRAECDLPVYQSDTAIITGRAPAMTTARFAERITQMTHGRGLWRTRFDGYEIAAEGCGHPIARTTPDPTNPKAYMLAIAGM